MKKRDKQVLLGIIILTILIIIELVSSNDLAMIFLAIAIFPISSVFISPLLNKTWGGFRKKLFISIIGLAVSWIYVFFRLLLNRLGILPMSGGVDLDGLIYLLIIPFFGNGIFIVLIIFSITNFIGNHKFNKRVVQPGKKQSDLLSWIALIIGILGIIIFNILVFHYALIPRYLF